MLSKCLCRHFFAHTCPFFFKFIQHCVYLLLGNWALLAGFPYATLKLFTIVTFAGVVFLNDNEICRLDTFKCGKSVVAFSTFTSSTNLSLLMCFARIQDPGVVMFTFRTKHFESF
jgi:hypothetical protein